VLLLVIGDSCMTHDWCAVGEKHCTQISFSVRITLCLRMCNSCCCWCHSPRLLPVVRDVFLQNIIIFAASASS
jgi:hypothetical protein